MSECKHGVSPLGGRPCYNCLVDENTTLRAKVEAMSGVAEAAKLVEKFSGELHERSQIWCAVQTLRAALAKLEMNP